MAKSDYDKDGDNDMKAPQTLGKLYGSPSFETGPGKNKPEAYQKAEMRKSGSIPATGPKRNDASIGKDVKGSTSSGTKRDEKNEDYA